MISTNRLWPVADHECIDPRTWTVIWFGYHDQFGAYAYQTEGGMFLLDSCWP